MAVPDTQTNPRLHPDEDLRRKDGIVYQCKFEGTYTVAEAKGIPVVQKACEQMREGKTKRKDMGVKQAPMVAVHISVQGIEVFSGEEVVTKSHILKVPIEKISYIARDPNDRHYLAVVYETSPPAPSDKPDFECTLFKHDINKTREMVLTLNQAFDLAYELRIKEGKIPKVSLKEQVDIYRSRLKQLSDLLPSDKLADFLRLLNIKEVTEIKGLDTGMNKGPAPHTMITQASVDPLAQQQKPPAPAAAAAAPAPVAAAASPPALAAPTKPAQPLLSTATAAAPLQPPVGNSRPAELIVDFGGDDLAWAPVQQQQQPQPPPPTRPAPTNPWGSPPAAQAHQQQPPPVGGFGGGGGFDSAGFFGAPFAPPTSSAQPQPQQQQQQQQQAGQDLMRLGFGPLDTDFEFDPLKMK